MRHVRGRACGTMADHRKVRLDGLGMDEQREKKRGDVVVISSDTLDKTMIRRVDHLDAVDELPQPRATDKHPRTPVQTTDDNIKHARSSLVPSTSTRYHK